MKNNIEDNKDKLFDEDLKLIFSAPNLITILRILLIPIYINYFLAEKYLLTVIVFAFSAITDYLDGYIARKYNLTSKLGKILDPFADKLTVISILIALVLTEIIPQVVAIIILTREIFIFLSSTITYILGINIINPSYLGKISIFLLYLVITAKLLKISHVDYFLYFVVLPMNVISGIDYVINAYKEIYN